MRCCRGPEKVGGVRGGLGLPAVNTAAQDQGFSDSTDSTALLSNE